MHEVIACTEREGGPWVPYDSWILSPYRLFKWPAAELWSNGRIYDYVLEYRGEYPWRDSDNVINRISPSILRLIRKRNA